MAIASYGIKPWYQNHHPNGCFFCWNGWFLGIFCHQNRQLQELLQCCWFPAWKQPVNPCFVKGESWKCYKLYPRPRFCRGLYIGHKQIYFLQFTSWSCFFDFLFVVGPAGPMLEKVMVKQLQEAPRLFSIARHSSTWQTLWMPRLPWKIPPSQWKPRNPRHSMNADLTFGRWVGELAFNHMRHSKYVYIYIHIWFTFFWCTFYLYINNDFSCQTTGYTVTPLDDFQIAKYSEDVGIKFDLCWCKRIPHRMESLSLGKMI